MLLSLLALATPSALAADVPSPAKPTVVRSRNRPAQAAVRQLPRLTGLVDRWDSKRSWGSPLLVRTLTAAVERIAWENPDYSPVTVGDISKRGGGKMYGHSTHDLGVDADLGLFVHGGIQRHSFLDVTPADFDPAANWKLIQALLDSGNVQFILLDQRHIDRLRTYLISEQLYTSAELEAILVPPKTRLAWNVRGVVRHAPNHRSHMHVRITRAPPPPPVN